MNAEYIELLNICIKGVTVKKGEIEIKQLNATELDEKFYWKSMLHQTVNQLELLETLRTKYLELHK